MRSHGRSCRRVTRLCGGRWPLPIRIGELGNLNDYLSFNYHGKPRDASVVGEHSQPLALRCVACLFGRASWRSLRRCWDGCSAKVCCNSPWPHRRPWRLLRRRQGHLTSALISTERKGGSQRGIERFHVRLDVLVAGRDHGARDVYDFLVLASTAAPVMVSRVPSSPAASWPAVTSS